MLEKQRKRHGLTAKQLKIKADAMEEIIDGYTREAGVRQLERTIGEVCRKAVKMILSGERKTLTVTKKNLEQLLGARKIYAGYNFTKSRRSALCVVWHGQESAAQRFPLR